jgi:hypothetical protein
MATQVRIWRRSYATRPPALELADPRHPRYDIRYRGLDEQDLPAAESLQVGTRRLTRLTQIRGCGQRDSAITPPQAEPRVPRTAPCFLERRLMLRSST